MLLGEGTWRSQETALHGRVLYSAMATELPNLTDMTTCAAEASAALRSRSCVALWALPEKRQNLS